MRTHGERDRDRILYSSALRRLAGVTQVVKAGEADVYHNRLTHTLEVAQIGRRMAQYLQRYMLAKPDLAALQAMCDPDVVEAACLAHDLGHPPFGHVAEEELDKLAIEFGNDDGFEGNAQSFRIVTRLSKYSDGNTYGLNLSRATLNAVLKYPWLRDVAERNTKKYRKYGAYREDEEAFVFAREGYEQDIKSLEAQVMDHADAIAYAVHDLSDFYKSGILNFYNLINDKEFFDRHFQRNKPNFLIGQYAGKEDEARRYLLESVVAFLPGKVYDFGEEAEVAQTTNDSVMIASLINRSLDIKKEGGMLIQVIDDEVILTINFLKSIIWEYVIKRPQLATQQQGQIKIIRRLFKFYYHALESREYRMLPSQYLDDIESGRLRSLDGSNRVRLAVDLVARLSENQAQTMYNRISGFNGGSLLEYI